MLARPSIVLVTVDAWRYDALGMAPDRHWLERYGLSARLRTPNLDRFTAGSTYFAQALATAPHTTPSHASIMTGRFPPQHGVRSFLNERLPRDIETLAGVLGRCGYFTVTLREAENTSEPGLLEKTEVLRGFEAVVNDVGDLVTGARQAASRGQPVLAFLHLWDLHAPYLFSHYAKQADLLAPLIARTAELGQRFKVAPPQPAAISERSAMDFQRQIARSIRNRAECIRTLFEWYLDGLAWFDQHRWPVLMAALASAGLSENTVTIMYGDHGEGVHPDGEGMHCFDHGLSLLDDVLRVPLVVRGVPCAAPGMVRQQVSLVDLAPTVLDILGLDVRELFGSSGRTDGGHSLLLQMREPGCVVPPRLHFAELCTGGMSGAQAGPSSQQLYQRCVRSSDLKLVCHDGPIRMKRYMAPVDCWNKLRVKLQRFVRGRGPTQASISLPRTQW